MTGDQKPSVAERSYRSVDLFDIGAATLIVIGVIGASAYFGHTETYSRWQMFVVASMAALMVFFMAWRDSKRG